VKVPQSNVLLLLTSQDTGCGKTTVVQFLSLLQKKALHAVNCHATTETSDLLGGLRPVRGRDVIQGEIYEKLRLTLSLWSDQALLNELDIPMPLLPDNFRDESAPMDDDEGAFGSRGIQSMMPDVETMLSIAKALLTLQLQVGANGEIGKDESRTSKRRKLGATYASSDEETVDDEKPIAKVVAEIELLARRYNSLFEWSDGPLVTAMKEGQMLLLDEMSLAEDAVLERLNSVLESSRTLVLAEKGDDGSPLDNRVVVAHDDFRVFATMNPGGDFGKRELSPALRSRFTEIWVPAVTERDDFELVLSRTLENSHHQNSSSLVARMLNYVDWFNNTICGDPTSPCANYSLSLRDVLSWVHFIREACNANAKIGLWEAYLHGAALMHLDGLGLGAGLALEDADVVRTKCESFIRSQISNEKNDGNMEWGREFAVTNGALFGAAPFFIPLGPIEVPFSNFNMAAPTTATNAFRVLRAMQIKKPILLEGSPGVGKTR
jgi:midasin